MRLWARGQGGLRLLGEVRADRIISNFKAMAQRVLGAVERNENPASVKIWRFNTRTNLDQHGCGLNIGRLDRDAGAQ